MTKVPSASDAEVVANLEAVPSEAGAARRLLSPVMRFVRQIDAISEVLASSDHLRSLDNQLEAALRLVKRSYPDVTDDQQHIVALRSIESLTKMHPQTADPEELLDERSSDVSPPKDDATREEEFAKAFESTAKDIETATGHDSFLVYFNAWMEAGVRPDRLPMLYASLLVTAVSSFEMLVSNIVRAFYSEHPEALRASDTKYSLSDIEGFGTLDEFRAYCAERQADSLLYGGMESWIDWFARQLKISWSSHSPNLPELTEVYQRRNIIVHNDGQVNRQYLSKVGRAGESTPIGTQLTIDREYCESAIDLLIETGVRIGLAVVRKFAPELPEATGPADWYVQYLTFDYLVQRRFMLTVSLLDALLPDVSSEHCKMIMKVNRWIALKEINGLEAIRSELQRWDTTILSAEYRLAKLVLTGDIEEAAQLATTLRESGELSVESWLTWPLLREVREFHAAQSITNEPTTGG